MTVLLTTPYKAYISKIIHVLFENYHEDCCEEQYIFVSLAAIKRSLLANKQVRSHSDVKIIVPFYKGQLSK